MSIATANDRELRELQQFAVDDLAEAQAYLEAVNDEMRKRGIES